jgi:hypothetical protein
MPITEALRTMPFTLNRDMQGPKGDLWEFLTVLTHEGSDVEDLVGVTLSYTTVAQIFHEVLGAIPANGIGHDEVAEHWDALEPRLRAAIAPLLPPEVQ